jgi:hypothetical protein
MKENAFSTVCSQPEKFMLDLKLRRGNIFYYSLLPVIYCSMFSLFITEKSYSIFFGGTEI